jgi:hypothetical protein
MAVDDTLYCAYERRSFPITAFELDVRHGAIHVPQSGSPYRLPPHSVSGYELQVTDIPGVPAVDSLGWEPGG